MGALKSFLFGSFFSVLDQKRNFNLNYKKLSVLVLCLVLYLLQVEPLIFSARVAGRNVKTACFLTMQNQETFKDTKPICENHTSEKFWKWKGRWEIHYAQSGNEGPPLLFVPGFGVGTYHFERNIPALAAGGHRVFAIDLLGQGQSWPPPGMNEGFAYNVDLWRDQLISFIEEVIREPVYLAGNSLGGLLSVGVASKRPDLVKALILLNATPFWAFLPAKSKSNPTLERLIPWDGILPAPANLLKIGSNYFDQIRNERTVRQMLGFVYRNPQGFDDRLVNNIISSASHVNGHSTFTSILFSRKSDTDFEEDLAKISHPVCLIYGKEDPWVVPLWGQKIKRQIPTAEYFEVSPCGHCPHHEAPDTVNYLLQQFIQRIETGSNLEHAEGIVFQERITGQNITAKLVNGSPRNFFEWLSSVTEKSNINYSPKSPLSAKNPKN